MRYAEWALVRECAFGVTVPETVPVRELAASIFAAADRVGALLQLPSPPRGVCGRDPVRGITGTVTVAWRLSYKLRYITKQKLMGGA